MIGSRWSVVLAIGLGVAAFSVGLVLGRPISSPAQQAPTPAPAASPAAVPPDSNYVGAETCKGCHEEQYNKFAKTRMGRLFLFQARDAAEKNTCENCHGPGKAHVEAGGGKGKGGLITFAKNDPTPVLKRNQVCLDCHTKGERIFWKGSSHESRNVACTNCHTLMDNVSPKHQLTRVNEIETCGTCHLQKRAQTMRTSHMPVREGKMTCTSCHSPHGSVTPALLKEPSLNDSCFTCHTESGHVSRPYGPIGTQQKFVMGRSCNDCHVAVHGSNHPAGFRLTR